jgi:hypothetical protein
MPTDNEKPCPHCAVLPWEKCVWAATVFIGAMILLAFAAPKTPDDPATPTKAERNRSGGVGVVMQDQNR